MTSRIDSKVLSTAVPPRNHDFWPRPCTYRAFMRSLNQNRAFLIACFWSRHLIRMAVELLQSLALHPLFHLRILLEDLRVSLAKHSGYPLVRYPSGAEPCAIGRAEVVKAKIPHLRPPQRRLPGSLQQRSGSNCIVRPSRIEALSHDEVTLPGGLCSIASEVRWSL
jgi:hypothetical protein